MRKSMSRTVLLAAAFALLLGCNYAPSDPPETAVSPVETEEALPEEEQPTAETPSTEEAEAPPDTDDDRGDQLDPEKVEAPPSIDGDHGDSLGGVHGGTLTITGPDGSSTQIEHAGILPKATSHGLVVSSIGAWEGVAGVGDATFCLLDATVRDEQSGDSSYSRVFHYAFAWACSRAAKRFATLGTCEAVNSVRLHLKAAVESYGLGPIPFRVVAHDHYPGRGFTWEMYGEGENSFIWEFGRRYSGEEECHEYLKETIWARDGSRALSANMLLQDESTGEYRFIPQAGAAFDNATRTVTGEFRSLALPPARLAHLRLLASAMASTGILRFGVTIFDSYASEVASYDIVCGPSDSTVFTERRRFSRYADQKFGEREAHVLFRSEQTAEDAGEVVSHVMDSNARVKTEARRGAQGAVPSLRSLREALLECKTRGLNNTTATNRGVTYTLTEDGNLARVEDEELVPITGEMLDSESSEGAPGRGTDESEYRTWTTADGQHTTVAKFVEFQDSKAHLEKQDGATIALSMTALCKEDQQWIREELKRRKSERTPVPQERNRRTRR